MKSDLAPRFFYYINLIGLFISLVFIAVIHQKTMDLALETQEFVPFILTSIFGTVVMLLIGFSINRVRYITINPASEDKFIMGNLLSNSLVSASELRILKKVWMKNMYKINVSGKNYYMLTHNRTVEEFKHNTDFKK